MSWFLLFSILPGLAGLYKIFEKAGIPGWKALVPVYNFVVWIKLVKAPWWWIFLVIIPTVGFFMLAILIVMLSNHLGKRKFTDHVFAVLGYFIWLPMNGFSKEVKWVGPPPEVKDKPMVKEWGEAIVFAVVAATLIRTFFFEAFVIPTSSMEGSLLVGDYLFVSKMSYGPKVPSMPLTVPFTHNTLPVIDDKKSYVDWVELPYLRLPGFGKVERNDIVVFNFPEGDTVYKSARDQSYYAVIRNQSLESGVPESEIRKRLIDNDELLVHPIDKEDNYVKRCVAIAGDEFQIINNQLKVNGQPAYEPKELQFSYFLSQAVNTDELGAMGIEAYATMNGIIAMLSKREIEMLIKRGINCFPLTDSVRGNAPVEPKDFALFPHQPQNFRWTRDNYGPVRVPKKGVTVQLTVDTLPLYERIIRVYEGNTLEVKNGVILINGQPSTSYTFKQDYYFMMGDNRHNSLDSRYWGFVPETHIVGKPVFIWNSRSQYTGFRTERMMTLVNKEGLSKSYLWFVLFGIAASIGYSQWKSRKKKTVKPGLKPRK